MLGLVGSALRRDRGIGNHRKAALATEVVRATVKPRTTVPYQVDGDYLGQADRLEFTWEPESLRLIVPHPPEAES